MGFTKNDFYKFHPGGHLGQRLMARVKDVMIGGDDIPGVFSGTSAIEAIEEMDRKNLGFIFITDRENHLLGILTDGDLRRHIRKKTEFKEKLVDDLMTDTVADIREMRAGFFRKVPQKHVIVREFLAG